MMKRKILLILNMAIIGFSTAACSDDETNYITPEKIMCQRIRLPIIMGR